MTADESKSLADEAATWVPPWSRPPGEDDDSADGAGSVSGGHDSSGEPDSSGGPGLDGGAAEVGPRDVGIEPAAPVSADGYVEPARDTDALAPAHAVGSSASVDDSSVELDAPSDELSGVDSGEPSDDARVKLAQDDAADSPSELRGDGLADPDGSMVTQDPANGSDAVVVPDGLVAPAPVDHDGGASDADRSAPQVAGVLADDVPDGAAPEGNVARSDDAGTGFVAAGAHDARRVDVAPADPAPADGESFGSEPLEGAAADGEVLGEEPLAAAAVDGERLDGQASGVGPVEGELLGEEPLRAAAVDGERLDGQPFGAAPADGEVLEVEPPQGESVDGEASDTASLQADAAEVTSGEVEETAALDQAQSGASDGDGEAEQAEPVESERAEPAAIGEPELAELTATRDSELAGSSVAGESELAGSAVSRDSELAESTATSDPEPADDPSEPSADVGAGPRNAEATDIEAADVEAADVEAADVESAEPDLGGKESPGRPEGPKVHNGEEAPRSEPGSGDLVDQAVNWVPPWSRPPSDTPAAEAPSDTPAVGAPSGTSTTDAPSATTTEAPSDTPAAEASGGTTTAGAPGATPTADGPSNTPTAEARAADAPDNQPVAIPRQPTEPHVTSAEAGPEAAGTDAEAAGADAGPEPAQASPEAATTGDELPEPPPPISDGELKGALEAILLVVDEPVTEIMLAQVLDQPTDRVISTLNTLSTEYAETVRGFELRQAAGGWRLYTRTDYAPYVERFVLDGQQIRLTQAALETLAVVAYKQPVTRSRISAIRGVNCDGVVRTLVARGLIEECGSEPDSGAFLYRTTTLFLEKLGLNSVDQLPPLAPFLPDDVDEIADAQR